MKITKKEIFNLTTKELYDKFLEYFKPYELFSEQAYNAFKHYGDYYFLSRLDKRLIETMLWIRINKGKSITVNTWYWGGRFSQRGVRDTSTVIIQSKSKKDTPYLSAHPLSGALDYDVEGETAEQHREWLKEIADNLPYPIRLEHRLNGNIVTWVHLDICDDPKNPKVYQFNINN